MDATNKEEKPFNPRSKANFLEVITFSWVFKLVRDGLKKELETNDLYENLEEDSAAKIGKRLENLWNLELINAQQRKKKPSFLRILFQMFGTRFILIGLMLTIAEIVLSVGLSICVGQLVIHFDSNEPDSRRGVYSAVGIIVMCLLKAILFNSYDMEISHTSMKMRVASCNLIYKKTLRLKTSSLDQTSTGQVVNLMTNDVNRFDVIVYLPFLWIGPLETIVVTYFLWQEVGVSSVLGVATLLIFIPLQGWLGSITSKIRLKTANRTDERVNLMSEIISGLQVIKMYTWEEFFVNLTKHSRKKEIIKITQSSYIKGILSSFILFNTRAALFVNLFVYVLFGNYITASKVFILTSFYNILRVSMTLTFPPGLGLLAELLVSIKRIEDFLMYEEKDRRGSSPAKVTNGTSKSNNFNTTIYDNYEQNSTDQSCEKGIVISNATAKWSDEQTENSLKNINLTVTPGHLAAIIGPVGSGKSTLLQAILRELPLSEGNISVCGVVSYASQEPWLFSGSVQQNILFGQPMDKDRYKKVVQVCALKTDFEQFPYGDRTMVGEKGVSLSGGQRARINLARAVYKQADIYLLDDPLSAVDTHVGKHLFEKCIKEYLKEKTCILITHQVQHLTNVDQIVLMDNAKILIEGSYEELQSSTIDFTNLLGSSTEAIVTPDDETNTNNANNSSSDIDSVIRNRLVSISSVASSVEETKIDKVQLEPVETDETCSSGNVSWGVYVSYISAGGNCFKVFSFLLVCILTQALASGGDFWITYWVNLEDHAFRSIKPLDPNSTPDESIPMIVSRDTCVIVFAGLTVAVIIFALAEAFLLVSVCTTSSMNLHNQMFSAITKSTMNFLNKNPSGRILNRFSKDIGLIDEILPSTLSAVIQTGLTVAGILVVVAIVNPYLILPMIIVVVLFCKIRSVYMTTSRNIKRLEGVARSPMFTHVNASIQGLTTIRAFNVEEILFEEFACHQDLHSSAWFLFLALARGFGFWLDIVCLIFISLVTICFLVIGNETYGGNVGLAITQVIGLTGMFQWSMRQSAELENNMTSVERVLEYTKVPQEAALESSPDKKPPKEWPQNGQIVFNNFYLRYDLETPFVIRNLNVKIEPREKVGIVGRTGAGKSSLINALFRLSFNEGSIVIDDIEVHALGLHDLRSKISIIPQEPVLFSGTMRKNLDPFDEYPDHILWDALKEVELKEVVEDLPNGLNSKMSEGGSNFSVGQRQLVCLARAIVRNNKILVLDEATANVDPQTDALIQNTIRNKFRNCTVLTIAHRLNTVMDSDKILVMDAGTMVEFDHPYNLLKNEDGFLYKMVEQTGQSNIEMLHNIAEENYNR